MHKYGFNCVYGMKILVFDTESSTGCINDGSLCSIGYCICDEKFNITEQRDVIFNPLARFRPQILGKNSKVGLAYTKEQFRSAPRFAERYEEIKNVFASCDLAIGFAIENDVKYLRDACDKFNLDQIEYKFVDVKQLLELFNDEYKNGGLASIAEGLNIEFVAHRSDEDARVTLLVMKYLCEKNDMSFTELLDYAGIVFGENQKKFFSHSYSLSQLYERNGFVRTGKQTNALLDKVVKLSLKHKQKGGSWFRKAVAISKCIKIEDINKTYSILTKLNTLSARYAPCVQVSNVYVYRSGALDAEYEKAKSLIEGGTKIKLIEEREFYKQLGELPKMGIDYLAVIKDYDKMRRIKKSTEVKAQKVNKKAP